MRAPANPYNLGELPLAAATLEAADGMTSHGKTWYPDIVKYLARRWPGDAEFSKASGDSLKFTR